MFTIRLHGVGGALQARLSAQSKAPLALLMLSSTRKPWGALSNGTTISNSSGDAPAGGQTEGVKFKSSEAGNDGPVTAGVGDPRPGLDALQLPQPAMGKRP